MNVLYTKKLVNAQPDGALLDFLHRRYLVFISTQTTGIPTYTTSNSLLHQVPRSEKIYNPQSMDQSHIVTIRYNLDKWHEAQLNRGSDWSSANSSPSKIITLNYRKDRLGTSTPALSPVPWLMKKREEPRVRKPKYDENEPFLTRPVAESLDRLRAYETFINPEDPLHADKAWYHDFTNVAQRLKLLRDTYKVLQAVRKKRAMGERVDFRTAHELKSRTGSPVPLDEDRHHTGQSDDEDKPQAPPAPAPARRGRPRKRGGAARGRKPGPRLRNAIPAPAPVPTPTRSRTSRRREAELSEKSKNTTDSRASTPGPSEGVSHDETSQLTQVGAASLSQPMPGNEIIVPELMPDMNAISQPQRDGTKAAAQEQPQQEIQGQFNQDLDQQLFQGLNQELGKELVPGQQDIGQAAFLDQSQAAGPGQWNQAVPVENWQAQLVPTGPNQLEEYFAHGYPDTSSLSELTVSIIENLKRKNPSGLVLASLYSRPGGLNFLPQWATQQNAFARQNPSQTPEIPEHPQWPEGPRDLS